MDLLEPAEVPFQRVSAPARMQALQILRNAIQQGRFEPGRRLTERELLAITESSRTTLRETLRQLETEGLVEMVPGKGLIVARLSLAQASQIYEVREALEALAAGLFADNATAEEVAALGEIMEQLTAACGDDILRFLAVKEKFHRLLFLGARNEYLREVIKSLHGRIWQLKRLSLSAPGRPTKSLEEVRTIAEALMRRDGAAAAAAARHHIRLAKTAALMRMQSSAG